MDYRTIKIFIFLFFVFINSGFSTQQIADILIYKNDTFIIGDYVYPLENYFNDSTNIRPNKLFETQGFYTSASWRGYIGIWLIENDSLFLIELVGNNRNKINLKTIFPNSLTSTKIYAKWFSGIIYCPFGKHFSKLSYILIYEFEKGFTLLEGKVTNMQDFDNSKTFISKYTHDERLLIDYIQNELKKSPLLIKSNEPKKVFVKIISTNNLGRIDSVSIFRGIDKTYDNEAIRIVKSIPDWDVLYSHGKRTNISFILPINFAKKN